MGYMRHHAIIVTMGMYRIASVHAKAKEMFGEQVSEVLPPAINGYCSFFIGPDGSKEFWQPSDEGDQKRAEFKRFLYDAREDLYPTWVEVQYGDEEGNNTITATD